jgi:hypothetical protein
MGYRIGINLSTFKFKSIVYLIFRRTKRRKTVSSSERGSVINI